MSLFFQLSLIGLALAFAWPIIGPLIRREIEWEKRRLRKEQQEMRAILDMVRKKLEGVPKTHPMRPALERDFRKLEADVQRLLP